MRQDRVIKAERMTRNRGSTAITEAGIAGVARAKLEAKLEARNQATPRVRVNP